MADHKWHFYLFIINTKHYEAATAKSGVSVLLDGWFATSFAILLSSTLPSLALLDDSAGGDVGCVTFVVVESAWGISEVTAEVVLSLSISVI